MTWIILLSTDAVQPSEAYTESVARSNARDPIRVLLTSPDTAVRSGLARLLAAESDLEVHEVTASTEPDVVVAHLTHCDQAGELRRLYPRSRILARVSPLRPELSGADVDARVDNVAPYEVLVSAIRRIASA